VKPPTTLVRTGRFGVVKFPVKNMAPPTLVKDGKEMFIRALLLAMLFAPAMDLSNGKEKLVRDGLPAKVRLPPLVPIAVKLGAERSLKRFSSKVRVPLIVVSEGIITEEVFRKVALAAQTRFGRSTVRPIPLEAMFMIEPTLLT